MKTLEKITKHYHREINGELEKIEVPEWEMDIYFKRTYPFEDEAKVIELQSQGKVVDALVESLIVKARDKDGKRIFSEADRIVLMKEADPTVITKVAGTINNASLRPKVSDLAKE
jgi:hypothetical protein